MLYNNERNNLPITVHSISSMFDNYKNNRRCIKSDIKVGWMPPNDTTSSVCALNCRIKFAILTRWLLQLREYLSQFCFAKTSKMSWTCN